MEEIKATIQNTIRSKFYIYYGSSRFLEDFDIQFTYSDGCFIRIRKGETTQVDFSEGFQLDLLCRKLSELNLSDFFSSDRRAAALRQTVEAHILLLNPQDFPRFERAWYYPADRNIATLYSEQFRQIFLENFRSTSLLTGKNVPRSVHLELTREIMERSVAMYEVFQQNGGNFEELLATSRSLALSVVRDFSTRVSEILKGKYIIASGGMEKIKIEKGKHIELHRASSGQQSVVRILQELAIINSKNMYTWRTIEEPEVHLFPSAQNLLTELIIMTHQFTGSEFLLTTHSPYFLATFNNSLYAHKAALNDPDAVEAIGYPSYLRLSPENFVAFSIEEGHALPIFEVEDSLTSVTELDAVSLETGEKFSRLAEIVQSHEAFSL